MNKKINLILPKKQFQIQRVGIYARVFILILHQEKSNPVEKNSQECLKT